MRYALVDNSTLTAVQRVLGEIPIKNKYLVDGDILCLESYIQAILFYDKLVFLDDYKEEHRASRKAYFNNLLSFKPSLGGYNSLLTQAKRITEDIVPCVQGGKIADQDFRPFFELLKMNLIFTWDFRSSVYYLTIKMLEDVGGLDLPKYNELASMIFSELNEKSSIINNGPDSTMKLYDSKGNSIQSDYTVQDKYGHEKETRISEQVKAFFAGLNWLAFRTSVYTLVARELGADLFLHPIRHSFQVNLLNKLHVLDNSVFKPIISAMNNTASEAINKVMASTQPFVLNQPLPMFTVWLAEKTHDPRNFIEAAYELRKDIAFVQARQQLIELEEVFQDPDHCDFVTKANILVRTVQRQAETICAKFGVTTPQGLPLAPLLAIWNLTTSFTRLPKVPEINVDIKAAGLKGVIPVRGFKAVYRSLLQNLIQIPQMGKHHDIITSRTIYDEKATYYNLKTEEAKYQHYQSDWKIPM